MRRPSGQDLRGIAADAAAIETVALLLVGVHFLVPDPVRDGLAFHYARPDTFHALTAAYVHIDTRHLVGNVAAYVLGSAVAYAGCLAAGERRWFRFTGLALLTVLPVAVNLASVPFVDGAYTGLGFSAVVAGIAGFILVTAPVLLRRVLGYGWPAATTALALMGFVVVGVLLRLRTGAIPPVALAVLAAGAGLSLARLALIAARNGLPAGRAAWGRLAAACLLVAGVLGIVSWFLVGLFPAPGEPLTNVLSHYLGLVAGATIAGWGYRYWS